MNDNHFITFQQAIQRIIQNIRKVTDEQYCEIQSALGRTLSQPIQSQINVPPMDNSAMDGYAIHSDSLETIEYYPIVGTSWAGKPFTGKCAKHECIRIMTGAEIPVMLDTVVMQENIEKNTDSIKLKIKPKVCDNVRYCGDDIKQNDIVLNAGKKLQPADIGLLASLGINQVKVVRKLKVAILSTGDELCSAKQALKPGQIYDSNRYTLHAMLQNEDIDIHDLGIIPDAQQKIKAALIAASEQSDMVITSGGVSVGDADFVKPLLSEMGQIDFWKIKMKPGKPLAYGRLNDALFFGLPGNPVSVMATFYQFVLPALKAMQGQNYEKRQLWAKTTHDLKKMPGRMDFQRGILHTGAEQLTVTSSGLQSSGMLSSMSKANCFIVLEQAAGDIKQGEWVLVEPFDFFT